MATDRLINQTQGEDIIDKLNEIASNVGDIKFGPQVPSSNVVSMTGYAEASTADAISQGDTLNEAIGKLEKKADDNATAVAGKIDKLTSATAGDIATVTATGEIADSTVAIENTLSDTSDAKVPTSKAVGTYVAGKGYTVGVSSSTADHIVTFNGTDGKTLKDSGYIVNTTLTNVATDIPTGSAVTTALGGKVDKVTGKGLSENDYTTTEKNKLSGIEAQANKTVVDASLSDSSTNPVQNKVINTALAGKVAGPGSSTSNDIMLFGDATGKVASDSSVQIEKNTNFSDSSDAKIPTSKSIAQNVAGKAVLKNYTVATAQETISASTTIKDAVEQLDYHTTTNQNSISSVQGDITEINSGLVEVINDGAKNLFNITTISGTYVGITCTSAYDSFTLVSGTANATPSLLLLGNVVLSAGTYTLSGCPPTGSDNTYRLDIRNGDTVLGGTYGEPVEITVPSEITVGVYIRLQNGYAIPSGGLIFKPMLCTKAQFDVSPTHEPYALGNQYLTPVISQQVDGGVKNLLDATRAKNIISNGITFTHMSLGVWDAAGTCDTSTASVEFSYTPTKSGSYVLSGCPTGGSSSTYELEIQTTEVLARDYGTGVKVQLSAETEYTVKILVRLGTTVSNIKFYPMICTELDWNLSHKYQTFAEPNGTLTAGLVDVVDSNAKNILPIVSLVPAGGGLDNNPNLTCVNNGDGTYTLNGTTVASGQIVIQQAIREGLYGSYYLSGCPKGINTDTDEKVRLAIYTDANNAGVCFDRGIGTRIPSRFSASHLAIYVFAGYTFNNAVFKPMVCTRAVWDVSKKFVPYRLPYSDIDNLAKQLKSNAFVSVSAAGASPYVSSIEGGFIRIGNMVVVNIRCTTIREISATWTWLMSGFPYPIVQNGQTLGGVFVSNNKNLECVITGVGNLYINTAIASGTDLIFTCTYFTK